MTATEELRRLLDERGVEYTVVHGYQEYIWEFGESGIARASRIGTKGLVQMIVTGITPEQAIAATLGPGTCEADVLHDVADLLAENATLRQQLADVTESMGRVEEQCAKTFEVGKRWMAKAARFEAENAKLREQLERVQPTDCEGNVLDIADTVHMLRSEYDGDHEWEDVVTELVLTKWGGDRWIVRGSKGEAWACECTKTGYDEDAYEGSDDVEPFGEPTLLEVENAKLRELVRALICATDPHDRERLVINAAELLGELGVEVG